MGFEVTLRLAVRADFDAAAALGDAVKKAGYEFIEQHWTVSGAPLPDEGGNFDITIAPLDEDAQTAAGKRPRHFRESTRLKRPRRSTPG